MKIRNGVFFIDSNGDARPLIVSERFANLYGYSKEEFMNICQGDYSKTLSENDIPFIKKTFSEVETRDEEQINLTARIKHKSGKLIFIDFHFYRRTNIFSDDRIYYVVASNVSPQFNNYKDICDNSVDGVVVFDSETFELYYGNDYFFSPINGKKQFGISIKDAFDDFSGQQIDQIFNSPKASIVYNFKQDNRSYKLSSSAIKWFDRPSILIYITDITDLTDKNRLLQSEYNHQLVYAHMISNGAAYCCMCDLNDNACFFYDVNNSIFQSISFDSPKGILFAVSKFIPNESIRARYLSIFDSDAIISNYQKGISEKSLDIPFSDYFNWFNCKYQAIINPDNGHLELFFILNDISYPYIKKNLFNKLYSHTSEYIYLANIDNLNHSYRIDLENGIFNIDNIHKSDDMKKTIYRFRTSATDISVSKMARYTQLSTIKERLENQNVYDISFSMLGDNNEQRRKRISFFYLDEYKKIIVMTLSDNTTQFRDEIKKQEELTQALN
ncbi:MAG: PAS domain-containing protein [Bacilli bacterium]